MEDKAGIIIPLDGSETATVALGVAQAMARMMGAVLHIVHVTETRVPESELLGRLQVSGLKAHDFILHQKAGDAVDAVIEVLSPPHMKMIVMSSHGFTFDAQALMGQTAMGIIQRSPDPVMVIRPDMKNLPGEDWTPGSMLVPLNGSPGAAAAMDRIIELAEIMECSIDVVHVAVLGREPSREAGSLVSPRYLDYPYYDWEAWVDEFMARFARRPPSVKLKLFHREGVPADEMLKLALESEQDLITLTWQGNLEKGRALTIKRILRLAGIPVVLIRT